MQLAQMRSFGLQAFRKRQMPVQIVGPMTRLARATRSDRSALRSSARIFGVPASEKSCNSDGQRPISLGSCV